MSLLSVFFQLLVLIFKAREWEGALFERWEPTEGAPAAVETSYDEKVSGTCKSEQLEGVWEEGEQKEGGSSFYWKIQYTAASSSFLCFSLCYKNCFYGLAKLSSTNTDFVLVRNILLCVRDFPVFGEPTAEVATLQLC